MYYLIIHVYNNNFKHARLHFMYLETELVVMEVEFMLVIHRS